MADVHITKAPNMREAGFVTKEIKASEVKAWFVDSESEPRSFAWMAKAMKVATGAKILGVAANYLTVSTNGEARF